MTLSERAEKYLKDSDWDYLKYGDRRGDRSAYDTLMNYEISGYLADAFEAGFKEAIALAAEIAEGQCGMHPDFWDASKQAASRVISKEIRALAEGEMK